MTRVQFHQLVETVTGTEAELLSASAEEIVLRLSAAQYAADVLTNLAEQRGLIAEFMGMPVIPYEPPDGVPPLETILTRAAA